MKRRTWKPRHSDRRGRGKARSLTARLLEFSQQFKAIKGGRRRLLSSADFDALVARLPVATGARATLAGDIEIVRDNWGGLKPGQWVDLDEAERRLSFRSMFMSPPKPIMLMVAL